MHFLQKLANLSGELIRSVRRHEIGAFILHGPEIVIKLYQESILKMRRSVNAENENHAKQLFFEELRVQLIFDCHEFLTSSRAHG